VFFGLHGNDWAQAKPGRDALPLFPTACNGLPFARGSDQLVVTAKAPPRLGAKVNESGASGMMVGEAVPGLERTRRKRRQLDNPE